MDYKTIDYQYDMSEEEFIIFLTLLFYYKPEIHIKHQQSYDLLYKDLINTTERGSSIPAESGSSIPAESGSSIPEKEMLKYWHKVL